MQFSVPKYLTTWARAWLPWTKLIEMLARHILAFHATTLSSLSASLTPDTGPKDLTSFKHFLACLYFYIELAGFWFCLVFSWLQLSERLFPTFNTNFCSFPSLSRWVLCSDVMSLSNCVIALSNHGAANNCNSAWPFSVFMQSIS